MAEGQLKRELGFRDLTLFYVVTSLSLRWIPTAAAVGESAVTVWVLALCGFFLPLAVSILELSSRYPQEGWPLCVDPGSLWGVFRIHGCVDLLDEQLALFP